MQYATTELEVKLWDQGKNLVCGVDEVGRGCFAGPVIVGAVIFPSDALLPRGLADSKLLSSEVREVLAVEIKKIALSWAVAEISVNWINKVGIGKATQMAFRKAVKSLNVKPQHILIDAFYIKGISRRKQSAIKRGDRLSVSIAAASIIAKVHRDNLMKELSKKYPQYGLAKHKGYGTKHHQAAIKQFGLSKLHRKSFDLLKFLV